MKTAKQDSTQEPGPASPFPFASVLPALGLVLVGTLLAGACRTAQASGGEQAQGSAAAATTADTVGPAAMWARNCARCHGYQPASRYSDSQWKLVMRHMRQQCYLTGKEQRAIEELMRAGNN